MFERAIVVAANRSDEAIALQNAALPSAIAVATKAGTVAAVAFIVGKALGARWRQPKQRQ
ncbi:hypothetical protein LBMAG49_25930 [Planctomycetota bacterium]|nr:hypothetical protein LBMAG49_25930 [Planctomycetota bacterium]